MNRKVDIYMQDGCGRCPLVRTPECKVNDWRPELAEREPIPDELQQKFDELPELQMAFEALTLGRQRGYILHFSSAKQSKTRTSRLEKCIPKIVAGKGFHDR